MILPIRPRARAPSARDIVETASSALVAHLPDPVTVLDAGDVVVVVARGARAKLVERAALTIRDVADADVGVDVVAGGFCTVCGDRFSARVCVDCERAT